MASQFDATVNINTGNAAKSLQTLGTAAGATQTKLNELNMVELGRIGQSALDASRRAGGAFTSLVRSASSVIEQQNFVDQVFGDSAESIKEWAQDADRSSLISQSAALRGAAYLGVFGKQIGLTGTDLTGFSSRLVLLASDMASIADTPVEDAVVAIGAAMRNEYEPMRKYGVVFNDAIMKQTLFELTGTRVTGQLTQQQKILAVNQGLFDKLGFAIGDVDRTFGNFANQERYLQAQLENLKAEVGAGLIPTFVALLEGANFVVAGLRQIPEPVAAIGAKIALTGVGFLGAAGGMTLFASKIPGALTSFRSMKTTLNDMSISTSGFNRAVPKMVKGIGYLAVAMAGISIGADAWNAATGAIDKTNRALGDIQVANAERDIMGVAESFNELAKQVDKTISFGNVVTDWGKKIALPLTDSKRSVEDLDKAFAKMLTQDPGAAASYVDWLREQNEQLDHSSQQYKDVDGRVKAWSKRLEETVSVQQVQGDVTAFTTEQLKIYGSEALAAAGAEEEAAAAAAELNAALVEMRDELEDVNEEFAAGTQLSELFLAGLDKTTGITDLEQSLVDMSSGVRDLFEEMKNDEGVFDVWKSGLDTMSESGATNLANVESLADAYANDLAATLQRTGGDMDAVIRRSGWLEASFRQQAEEAGLTGEQIDEYVEKLLATPEEIETELKIAGQALALQKIEALGIEIDQLPDEVVSQYVAAINSGDYVLAWEIAQATITGKGPLSTPLEARGTPVGPVVAGMQAETPNLMSQVFATPTPTENARRDMQWEADQNPIKIKIVTGAVPRAVYDSSGNIARYVAARPEPTADPTAPFSSNAQTPLAQGTDGLLGAPLATSLPGVVTAGRSAPTATTNIMNVSVNMPVGSDEVRVISALKRYQNHYGSVPVRTTS